MARGSFIDRQDAGDLSLPGRLLRQVRCLQEHPEASLCSTHVRLVVPEGATVRVNAPEPADLADGLTGPAIHGSVMMRGSAYERAGGYRPMFYFAQDIDLWSRMVELGGHLVVPEVLYEATLSPGSAAIWPLKKWFFQLQAFFQSTPKILYDQLQQIFYYNFHVLVVYLK